MWFLYSSKFYGFVGSCTMLFCTSVVWFFSYSWGVQLGSQLRSTGRGVRETCAVILAAGKNALPNKTATQKAFFLLVVGVWVMWLTAGSPQMIAPVQLRSCQTVGGGRCFLTQLCHQTVLCVAVADVSVISELSWCSLG